MPRLSRQYHRSEPPYYLRHAGAPWSATEIDLLRTMASGTTPTRVIAFKLGRTISAVKHKASTLGLTLKPVSGVPDGRAA